MSQIAKLAQRFQSVEDIAPKRWRLPLRYHGQHLVGGLEPEMALLPKLVRAECTALDIGANHGVYSYALSRLATMVHCFEPLSECCRYIQDYDSARIMVHNTALSDQAGELELHVPLINGRAVYTRASLDVPNGPSEPRHVSVRTLDSYELTNVGFIKIDVEGVEASVLRGGWGTIRTHLPAMLIEVDRARHSPESFDAIFAMLRTLEYTAYVCVKGTLQRCEDAWRQAATHINFIFLQGDSPQEPLNWS